MPTALPSDAVVATDPRKDLLLNGSIEKLPKVCESMEELIHEVRKYSDNDLYFMQIFPLFLDRVFGEKVMDNTPEPTWVRGDEGGWLKKAAESSRKVTTTPQTFGSTGDRRTDRTNAFVTQHGMSDFAATLLHLFVPEGPVSKMVNDGQYHQHLLCSSLEVLPKKVQLKLQGLSAYNCVRSVTNHGMYDHWCQRSNTIVSNLMSAPGINKVNSSGGNQSNVIVNLSLQNYFFVSFLRYPTVEVDAFPRRNSRKDLFTKMLDNNDNISKWSRGNPYLHLLDRYLHLHLPVSCTCSPAAHDPPDHNQTFLQLAIDYWVDPALVVKFDFDRVALSRAEYLKRGSVLPAPPLTAAPSAPLPSTPSSLRGRGGRHSPRLGSNASPRHHQQALFMAYDHPTSTEVQTLENISNKSFLPTRNTMQCIYMLVHHCMARMTAEFLQRELALQTSSLEEREQQYRRGGGDGCQMECLPLPYTLQALQQPLFDLLRVIFKADGIDKDVFALGVQIWHLWLSPWCRSHKQSGRKKTHQQSKLQKLQALKTTVTETVMKESATYDREQWEMYVASNLHFYTTLLVLFVQSPSLTRDLGVAGAEGVYMLSKTLQLFGPPLEASLDVLNKGSALWLLGEGKVHGELLQDMTGAVELSQCALDCVNLQDHQLFPGLAAQESCSVVDFHVLIRLQAKTIIEILRGRRSCEDQGYFEAGIMTLIDGVMSLCGVPVTVMAADRHLELTDIEIKLGALACLRACDLAGLGVNASGGQTTVQLRDAERVSEVSEDASLLGTLTPRGRQQVLQGGRGCDRSSIAYRRDPLTRPFLSTDLHFLVRHLVQVSKACNAHFGLPRSEDSVFLSWSQMIQREVHRHETQHGASTANAFTRFFYLAYLYTAMTFRCIPQGFRFNVRSLGNVIFVCKVGVLATILLFCVGMVSGGASAGALTALLACMRVYGWHQS